MNNAQPEGLGTARALLDAGNTTSAKRILAKLLERDGDNAGAAILMARALKDEEDHHGVISFCDDWLTRHPDHVPIHEARFFALVKLKRKKEMRASLAKFRENFPMHEGIIAGFELIIDAGHGNAKAVRKRIHDLIDEDAAPHELKIKGILLERTNDMFEADHVLEQALEYFPEDHDLLTSMAVNRFQLGRLSSARTYAARALAVDPTQRHPKFLSCVSWLFYYPGFYVLLIGLSMVLFLKGRFNPWVALFFGFAAISLVAPFINLSGLMLLVLLGIAELRFATMAFLGVLCLTYLAVEPQLYSRVFGHKKHVQLKQY